MTRPADSLAERNIAVFAEPQIVSWYLDHGLDPAERRLFIDWERDYAGARVLDLGVGTGRTTAVLAPCARDYLGIDLSEPMLAQARARFPGVDLRRMDIRDVGGLPDAGRDYALASNAALDVFEREERRAAIAAIRGALRAGGLFVFSFHNLGWRFASEPPQRPRGFNPLRLARDMRQYRIGKRNYRARAGFERRGEDHAMLRDMAHQWRCVLHYATIPAQLAELDALGFETTALIGADGREMRRDDPGLDDPTPYLRCRKR